MHATIAVENRSESGSTPSVTIVFLVYNRCDELRTSLRQMTQHSDYDPARVDVIVVDNASTDGSAAMVRAEFPEVRLIERDVNVGVSGWNEGLVAADGDFILALDDDCYLPPDGLRRAIAAAEEHRADLVSFKVISTHDPSHVFTEEYLTGLFSFWGCAVLMRREVVTALGGYDPEIFVWANELEFMLRFFDHGFRHLHYPEVVAQHMKPPLDKGLGILERGYRLNARHWAYIATKLFDRRHAAGAVAAVFLRALIDGIRWDPVAFQAVGDIIAGVIHGLRHRDPVANPALARFYRRNFETYASPWLLLRPLPQLVRELPREIITQGRLSDGPHDTGARDAYVQARACLYPEGPGLLEFTPDPVVSRIEEPACAADPPAQIGMPQRGNQRDSSASTGSS